jgi:Fe/S biogenesis protein NfuA
MTAPIIRQNATTEPVDSDHLINGELIENEITASTIAANPSVLPLTGARVLTSVTRRQYACRRRSDERAGSGRERAGSLSGGRAGSLFTMSPLEATAAETSGAAQSEPIIVVTPEALDHLRELRDDEADGDKLGLRLAIASDPGEEFRYDLSFEEYLTAAFTDEVRTHDDLKVIIPGNDVDLLTGATLDYTSTQGLVIRNPNRPAAPSIEGLTGDDELSAEIEAMVATEVNPALAAHGGFVTYVGHDGEGTAYLTMGGGCHGCSMSKMTMLEGVQTMLVDAIEGVERVKDLTDHSTGENPFYS